MARSTTQTDRLEAEPAMHSKLQGQEARHPQIAEFRDPLQHGGLAAAGGTGQEQVLDPEIGTALMMHYSGVFITGAHL